MNAKQLERIASHLGRTGQAGSRGGGSAGTEPLAFGSDTVEHRAYNGFGEGAAYAANGYAVRGNGAYREPVAETFPLGGINQGARRDLPDMESRTLGTASVWSRCGRALGVASGFAVLWFLLRWAAENKADAFGWAGLMALIADYWYPWTPQVAKIMGLG